jgi:hypothetical protein
VTEWSLPGPARLFDEVCGALRDGIAVVLRAPAIVDLDTLEPLLSRELDWLRWQVVDLPALAGQHPSVALAEELELAPGTLATVLAAAEQESLALWLSGYEALDEEDARRWRAALSELGKGSDARAPVVVPIGGRAAAPPPKADAALRVLHWWGVVGRLDAAVALSRASLADGDFAAASAVEVAGHDLELVLRLVDPAVADPCDVVAVCRARAEELQLDAVAADRGQTARAREPGALTTAWACGAVDRFEDVLHWHPGLCGEDEIGRRLWAAQVRALMPQIDFWRVRLIEQALQRGALGTVAASFDLELPDLTRALRDSERRGVRHGLLEASEWLRHRRNDIAHLRTVPRTTWQEGSRLMRRAGLSEL